MLMLVPVQQHSQRPYAACVFTMFLMLSILRSSAPRPYLSAMLFSKQSECAHKQILTYIVSSAVPRMAILCGRL